MRISAKTIGSNSFPDRKTSDRILKANATKYRPENICASSHCYIEYREGSQHVEFTMGEIYNVHDTENYSKP